MLQETKNTLPTDSSFSPPGESAGFSQSSRAAVIGTVCTVEFGGAAVTLSQDQESDTEEGFPVPSSIENPVRTPIPQSAEAEAEVEVEAAALLALVPGASVTFSSPGPTSVIMGETSLKPSVNMAFQPKLVSRPPNQTDAREQISSMLEFHVRSIARLNSKRTSTVRSSVEITPVTDRRVETVQRLLQHLKTAQLPAVPQHLDGSYRMRSGDLQDSFSSNKPSISCSQGKRCDHIDQWKRLRAKKGMAFYVCMDCGSKWRVPSKQKILQSQAMKQSGMRQQQQLQPQQVPRYPQYQHHHQQQRIISGPYPGWLMAATLDSANAERDSEDGDVFSISTDEDASIRSSAFASTASNNFETSVGSIPTLPLPTAAEGIRSSCTCTPEGSARAEYRKRLWGGALCSWDASTRELPLLFPASASVGCTASALFDWE